jgi:hypothetical protein
MIEDIKPIGCTFTLPNGVACDVSIAHGDVGTLMGIEKANKHSIDVAKKGVLSMNEYVVCPNPQCTSGTGFKKGSAGSKHTCKVCGTVTCLDCEVVYHDGLTCSDF